MADFGYDVADYCDVARVFGNLADFDRLVTQAHCRGLRLILDFVPNHTSNEHPWFLESRSSRANPKRDWYIWREAGTEGALPNNWLSHFGGPAWEWDEMTKQYYYHSFLKEQPDLNWRNPAVKQAMYDVLRFWLDRGVDGFRVDVLWLLIKDDQFRDNPINPGYVPGESSHNRLLPVYTANRSEVHAIVAEMRSVMDAYPDRVLIGEIYLPIEQLVTYYGRDLKGVNFRSTFSFFRLLGTRRVLLGSWKSTKRPYRRALGRTGCWEITTKRGLRRKLVWRRRGLRQCYCLLCEARRRFIMGRKLG